MSVEAVNKRFKDLLILGFTGHTESGDSGGGFPSTSYLHFTVEVNSGDGTLWEIFILIEHVMGNVQDNWDHEIISLTWSDEELMIQFLQFVIIFRICAQGTECLSDAGK